MRVVSLAAGAGGMICGSCMRDNRLAATLRSMGRDVLLLPLYTPIRTDEEDASLHEVRFGGINVYLEQLGVRWLPEWLARVLDAPALLRHVMRFSSSVRAGSLGKLTVSILAGPDGAQKAEIVRLVTTLRDIRPDLVTLPNLMMLGIAAPLKSALNVPVICTLSGEDIFLDELKEPHRGQAFELIRQCVAHVDGFISVTRYFADHAARHFSIPRDRIHVIPMGIRVQDFQPDAGAQAGGGADAPDRRNSGDFTVGYLARVCPEKGLANLCDAMIELRGAGKPIRIKAAGYLARADRKYLKGIQNQLKQTATLEFFQYLGEITRRQKVDLLRSIDALSVPTEYVEAKGTYVLESLAAGVPVVQPNYGSFPELIEATDGGLLYDPHRKGALAEALLRLMEDDPLRRKLGVQGYENVRQKFTDVHMATRSWELYASFLASHGQATSPSSTLMQPAVASGMD